MGYYFFFGVTMELQGLGVLAMICQSSFIGRSMIAHKIDELRVQP